MHGSFTREIHVTDVNDYPYATFLDIKFLPLSVIDRAWCIARVHQTVLSF